MTQNKEALEAKWMRVMGHLQRNTASWVNDETKDGVYQDMRDIRTALMDDGSGEIDVETIVKDCQDFIKDQYAKAKCDIPPVTELDIRLMIKHLHKRGLIRGCEWREIESAPKDGQQFLVTDDECVIIAEWPNYPEPLDCHDCTVHQVFGQNGENVTHWQPLPNPPKGKSQ